VPGDMAMGCATAMLSNVGQFVVKQFFVPERVGEWAIDLNGDTHPDNRFGALGNAVAAEGIDLQPLQDADVAAGNDIVLIAVHSQDGTFQNDPCARVDVRNGADQPSPDFSGNGSFTPEVGSQNASFPGVLGAGRDPGPDGGTVASGVFSSPAPATATIAPAELHLKLPLTGHNAVHIIGGHVQFHDVGNGLIAGMINGAIPRTDIGLYFIPGVQAMLNGVVTRSPCDATCTNTRLLFDNGGPPAHTPPCTNTCQNPDGTCATAGDGQISYCEVSTSGVIGSLLSPDVQMLDAAGNYQPNPMNATPDSLSIGIGFVAVPARF
jgi:hypothetical protein